MMVVPDETEKKWIGGEYVYEKIKRNVYQTFWKYEKHNEKIYIYLNKETIKMIILDDGVTAKELHRTNEDSFIFTSKNDIVKMFSKSLKRSIYLEDLLKKTK